jgi:hypothetical protein
MPGMFDGFRKHDYGIAREAGGVQKTALFCLTNKDTGNIPINIHDFNLALDLGTQAVILKIIPKKWSEILTMNQAMKLMEETEQAEGTDYKLISMRSVIELLTGKDMYAY